MITKILISIGSTLTIGFGIWHFFVPKAWKWYSYMTSNASELVVAVRAINVFFSLSLVLIGLVNIIFTYKLENSFALKTMLVVSMILWFTRIVMQLIYPQGTINPYLQYGMLSAFISIFLCFAVSFIMVLQAA